MRTWATACVARVARALHHRLVNRRKARARGAACLDRFVRRSLARPDLLLDEACPLHRDPLGRAGSPGPN